MNFNFIIIIIIVFNSLNNLSDCINNMNDHYQFPYKLVLDHDNRVKLEWDIKKLDKSIIFKLTFLVPIESDDILFGFGMSDRGEFINADIVLFHIDLIEKKFTIQDCHTDNYGVLIKDKKENYSLLGSIITQLDSPDWQIEILFTRKLDTCDKYGDYLIETGTVHLIHFYLDNHSKNSISYYLDQKTDFIPQRDAKIDMKQTQLIRSTYYNNEMTNTAKYFDVLNSDIHLSDAPTTYWCTVYKLGSQFHSRKHHIVGFEGLISKQNMGIVHHMELFHCIEDPSENMKSFSGPCTSESKPQGLTQCRKVIAAWAMGANRFVYPTDVGGVIGGENYGDYLVLETHFDNHDRRTNIVDNSGMRIFYESKHLRRFDAGIMEIGLEYNTKNSIPPKQSAFRLDAYCLSECTSVSLPQQGITVFASQLHTHLTGRRTWTSLVRNNKVIKIINSDNHYVN
jgi:dopamine beta-monooxygenase